MSVGRSGARAIALGGLVVLVLAAFGPASAWAEPSTYCVKATKVLTPKKHFTGGWNNKSCTSVNGTHEGKFEKLASFTESEEGQLKALLKYVRVQASGVGGKPTVQFSGANVQVVNGAGATAATNGEGNLVVGYDENTGVERGNIFNKGTPLPGKQTGSHNLILGYEQEFTSYSGLVAGYTDTITAPFASVTGGGNTVSGDFAAVSGGEQNAASGAAASVSGGFLNIASGPGVGTSVSGGDENKASGEAASISGGAFNTASNARASVSGGGSNTASGEWASVSGGRLATASGDYSSVSGGKSNTASAGESSVSGGQGNVASGAFASSVSGGEGNKASTVLSWIGGGFKNEVFSNAKATEEGRFASIFGGKELKTAKDYEVIP